MFMIVSAAPHACGSAKFCKNEFEKIDTCSLTSDCRDLCGRMLITGLTLVLRADVCRTYGRTTSGKKKELVAA